MNDITKFERNIIRGLLKGYSFKQVMTKINIDYFETLQLRHIFREIEKYYDKYSEVIQIDILISEVKNNKNLKQDDVKNIKIFLEKEENIKEEVFNYSIDGIEKEYLARKLRISMKRAIEYLDKNDPKKAQDILINDTTSLYNRGREVKVLDFVGDFKERKEDLVKRANGEEDVKEFCVPTGLPKLDYELDGGLRKGELGLILAQPSGGKSITLQDLSISAVLEGFKVALITIEMTPEQTSLRLDSRLTQIKYRKFRRAEMEEDDIELWERKIRTLRENCLKVIGVPEGCSCKLIEAELSRLSSVFRPDMIVIDYAQIMCPNSGEFGSSTDWKYVGEIIRNLKGLALKLNIPVWSACQLLVNSSEKVNISFVDIGLAKQQIAAHADLCIAIIQTEQMKAMDVTRLQLVKVREGSENPFIEVISDMDRISIERRIKE